VRQVMGYPYLEFLFPGWGLSLPSGGGDRANLQLKWRFASPKKATNPGRLR